MQYTDICPTKIMGMAAIMQQLAFAIFDLRRRQTPAKRIPPNQAMAHQSANPVTTPETWNIYIQNPSKTSGYIHKREGHAMQVQNPPSQPHNAERRGLISQSAPHNTGNDLLSHRIVAALPSAAEGLTSVFGMGTCVSPRL